MGNMHPTVQKVENMVLDHMGIAEMFDIPVTPELATLFAAMSVEELTDADAQAAAQAGVDVTVRQLRTWVLAMIMGAANKE